MTEPMRGTPQVRSWRLYPRSELGNPDPDHISTSFVERQNLTMRMAIRRFTRLTNAFSKKLTNLKVACALHFAYYNFCRVQFQPSRNPGNASGLNRSCLGTERTAGVNYGRPSFFLISAFAISAMTARADTRKAAYPFLGLTPDASITNVIKEFMSCPR